MQEAVAQWNKVPGTDGIPAQWRENQGQETYVGLLSESAPRNRREGNSLRSRGHLGTVQVALQGYPRLE